MTLVVAPCFSLTILFGLLACQSLSIDGQTYNVGTLYNARGQVAGYTYPDGKQTQLRGQASLMSLVTPNVSKTRRNQRGQA